MTNAMFRQRLAFGLRTTDALAGTAVSLRVVAEWWGTVRQAPLGPPALPAMPFWRVLPAGWDLGRYRVLHGPGVRWHLTDDPMPRLEPVRVRIEDPTRRFVPRRLTVPFPTEVELDTADPDDEPPRDSWNVRVWPGQAYPTPGGSTGLRGRLVDPAGRPVPWCRVVAKHSAQDLVIGRAHTDDRGEFLLVIGRVMDPGEGVLDLGGLIRLRAWVPPVISPEQVAFTADPLAALPIEDLPTGDADDVSDGEVVPDGYDPAPQESIRITAGRMTAIPALMVPAPT